MVVLVGLLVYQHVQQRSDGERRAEENLQRLALFAAKAERERFESAERLLGLAARAQQFQELAADPTSVEAFDRCTSTLFVLDVLLPGTSGFALWDTDGRVLCSSEAAKVGEFDASNNLWFTTAVDRGDFATGGFELSPPDDEPSLGFGLPIRATDEGDIVAYLSTGLGLTEGDELISNSGLPETGRLTTFDQNGVVISSTVGDGEDVPAFAGGQTAEGYSEVFASLGTFLDSDIGDVPGGRRIAAVRVTDADDAAVTVVVGAETDALVTPLAESLARDLWPVALLTLLALLATFVLAQQWIVRPVSSLVGASTALTSGDLGARAEASGGVSEFEQLAAAFNEMAAANERASHAKDEFLSLVSHELRTPITTVLGNAEILRKRGDRLDAEMRQGALDDIHESAERLVAIIDNLLTLARLERGAGLDSEPLALMRMADAATNEQLRRAPGRRVLVRGDGTILALGGLTYVEQVLRNLIGNAIKYSPADSTVDVIVEQEDGMAMVRVYDRGRGIDAAEREAIFEPFYRSDRTAGSAEGIGIGLSVCKRLIEALDGRIWVNPRDGGGSEFGFSLPLVTEDSPLVVEPEPISTAAT